MTGRYKVLVMTNKQRYIINNNRKKTTNIKIQKYTISNSR